MMYIALQPIALLNNIRKLLETILARRLFEEHKFLPESKMGARKGRSTATALQLLTDTIWEAKKNQVASMLCLDMLGAYDHVSHTGLLHILKCKGCPGWLLKWIESMRCGRTTAINLTWQWVVQPKFSNQGGHPSGEKSLLDIIYLL